MLSKETGLREEMEATWRMDMTIRLWAEKNLSIRIILAIQVGETRIPCTPLDLQRGIGVVSV